MLEERVILVNYFCNVWKSWMYLSNKRDFEGDIQLLGTEGQVSLKHCQDVGEKPDGGYVVIYIYIYRVKNHSKKDIPIISKK